MKTEITLLHDHFDPKHLGEIIEEMRATGAPEVRAYWCEALGSWLALEGCHRIRAAAALGMTPVIVPVDNLDAFASDIGLDWDDDEHMSLILDGAHARTSIRFEEGGPK